MEYESVKSFIRSLAHREHCEVSASVMAHGSTTEIKYPVPNPWPWPRQFEYTSEFFCAGSASSALIEVNTAPGATGEHVVNYFSPDLVHETQHFVEAGYAEAWVSALLGRSLSTNWSRPTVADAHIHEVADAKGMERYASLLGISNPGTARDPFIHNFFATVGSEVVAKGQLILREGTVAYVSDMFTEPAYRKSGLCNLIMGALENKARTLGATHACLAPGLEVASFGLYQKYGYEPVASRSVLIPRAVRGAASQVSRAK